MKTAIAGLHHVTAIASDPQRNLDFYTQVLGLRFVKRTVNFDDPGTYHFYFGDDIGTPGTILTFFPWPGTPRGRRGAGETMATAFSIPPGSMPYWRERLSNKSVPTEENVYFGATHLSFNDPDGMVLELVEHAVAQTVTAPRYADVPAQFAIQGFCCVRNPYSTCWDTASSMKKVTGLATRPKAMPEAASLMSSSTRMRGKATWERARYIT
jgi:glyoxalase family protein